MLQQRVAAGGYNLILASCSPRRQQLLEGCDLAFRVEKLDVDESYPSSLEASQVPLYLSQLKSNGYPTQLGQRDILITADTVVILDGQILGKPHDKQQAKEMLNKMSGREHTVVTGVTIRNHRHSNSFSSHSKVKFATLSPLEIEYYVEKYSPLDKAGSYGIQEWIGYVGIEHIEGSFYNVMGLPIQRLYTELNNFIE